MPKIYTGKIPNIPHNGIARAFSLVGALSIIRFRTPLKDTRDATFDTVGELIKQCNYVILREAKNLSSILYLREILRFPQNDRYNSPTVSTFVFLTLGIGFAAGTNAYAIAGIGVVLIGIFALTMHRIRLGESIKDDFLLRFRVNSSSNVESIYTDIFNRYLKKNTLVNMSTAHMDSFLEFAYSISLKDPKQQQSFIKELSKIPELEQIMLVSVDEVEEY